MATQVKPGLVALICLKCQRRFYMTNEEYIGAKKHDTMYCHECRREVGRN